MVAGSPCMCMRTSGTASRAQRSSMPASKRPAETSFTTSAPSASAAAATGALRVSTESGTATAARTARSTGRSRRSSSAASTVPAPGRVDSAPRSSMRAPAATMATAVAAARAGSRCVPPSEKESGVAFRMPTRAGRDRSRRPERVSRLREGTGGSTRGGGGVAQPSGGAAAEEADDLVDLSAVEHLALEEPLGDLVQRFEVAPDDHLGALVGVEHYAADLAVDLDRGGLGVVDALGEIAPEEDLFLLLAEGHGPELLAHAPLAHELARKVCGTLDI